MQILDTLFGGKSGKSVGADGLLCDHLLFLSPKLCVQASDPGVRIIQFFDEVPEERKDERTERLTAELTKASPPGRGSGELAFAN